MKKICSIIVGSEAGRKREMIYFGEEDGKLYLASDMENPIDGSPSFRSFDEAVDACDTMFGRFDINNIWNLKWEFEDDPDDVYIVIPGGSVTIIDRQFAQETARQLRSGGRRVYTFGDRRKYLKYLDDEYKESVLAGKSVRFNT